MKTTREVYALFDIAKDVGPALWMRTEEGMPEHQVNEMLEGHPDYPRKRVTVIKEEFQMKEQCVSSAGHGPTPPPCSAEIAAELYRLLEYYRDFMPFCVGMSESLYATTQEAINADAALAAYREQTGRIAARKPSEPNVQVTRGADLNGDLKL